jgi:hypothetical protein
VKLWLFKAFFQRKHGREISQQVSENCDLEPHHFKLFDYLRTQKSQSYELLQLSLFVVVNDVEYFKYALNSFKQQL